MARREHRGSSLRAASPSARRSPGRKPEDLIKRLIGQGAGLKDASRQSPEFGPERGRGARDRSTPLTVTLPSPLSPSFIVSTSLSRHGVCSYGPATVIGDVIRE